MVCLHVWLQARRGHQLSLQMVVSHHVVAHELNSGPLEEQPVLLTAEQSLQLPIVYYFQISSVFSVCVYGFVVHQKPTN